MVPFAVAVSRCWPLRYLCKWRVWVDDLWALAAVACGDRDLCVLGREFLWHTLYRIDQAVGGALMRLWIGHWAGVTGLFIDLGAIFTRKYPDSRFIMFIAAIMATPCAAGNRNGGDP